MKHQTDICAAKRGIEVGAKHLKMSKKKSSV